MALATESGYPAHLGGRRNPEDGGRGTTVAPSTAAGPKPLSVAEVVARVRAAVERAFPGPVWVEGELSNCSYPSSGHIYFTLVDERLTDRFGQRLVLPCAFFRGANQHLKFRLTDGMKVLCLGEVTTYEGRGQYQLRVLRVESKGVGALQLAFEQLKKRLQAEGLFAEARKRPIPRLVHRVGVITSPSGSAIHDIVSKLRGHFHVIVLPVKVQGEGAAAELIEAVGLSNRLNLADVLVVGRGGGSLEDLWAFNEEPLARAIARSRIPVISAVGHQDDWTIADYVADLRASTPTDAAKRLVQERELVVEECRERVQELVDVMQAFLDEQTRRLDTLGSQVRLLHPLNQLQRTSARADELQERLVQSVRHALDGSARHLQGLAAQLHALSPLAVLARGYSITLRLPDRHVVTGAASLTIGDEMETLLARGRVHSTVTRALTEPEAAS